MNKQPKYKVIGLSNNTQVSFSDEIQLVLNTSYNFSGGRRHYELVKKHLPEIHAWIDISGKMEDLFFKYASLGGTIVVFASGDPLFYGIVNTIQNHHPEAEIVIYPWFNSLQLLCHSCKISYHKMAAVSVHGRSWAALDKELIERRELIGVLTDAEKNPATIAKHLLGYGFSNYKMIVGEGLEGEDEKISYYNLEEAAITTFSSLSCLLLVAQQLKPKYFGIPDSRFMGLEGRPHMITKMPVRLASIAALDLYNKKTLWDIGFCTGSLSIEAKNHFPSLEIFSFEKRMECGAILDSNMRNLSTPGINKVMKDFFEFAPGSIAKPDAVFIGGHGNRLMDLLAKIDPLMQSGGRIVMNAVQENSKVIFENYFKKHTFKLNEPLALKVDEFNTIVILTAEKL